MSDPPAAVTGGEASPDRPAPADRGKLLTNAPAAAAYDPGRLTVRLRLAPGSDRRSGRTAGTVRRCSRRTNSARTEPPRPRRSPAGSARSTGSSASVSRRRCRGSRWCGSRPRCELWQDPGAAVKAGEQREAAEDRAEVPFPPDGVVLAANGAWRRSPRRARLRPHLPDETAQPEVAAPREYDPPPVPGAEAEAGRSDAAFRERPSAYEERFNVRAGAIPSPEVQSRGGAADPPPRIPHRGLVAVAVAPARGATGLFDVGVGQRPGEASGRSGRPAARSARSQRAPPRGRRPIEAPRSRVRPRGSEVCRVSDNPIRGYFNPTRGASFHRGAVPTRPQRGERGTDAIGRAGGGGHRH